MRGTPRLLGLGRRELALAAVDPGLDANHPVGGPRQRRPVVDVGEQRLERDAPLVRLLRPRHLRPAEAAREDHLDPLRAGLHRRLDRLLHRAPEGGPLLELLRDRLGDERGVELGTLDLPDVEVDRPARDPLERLLQAVDARPLAPDEHAGAGRVDDHVQRLPRPLDLHAGDPRRLVLLGDVPADLVVLEDVAPEIALRRPPPRAPRLDDADAEPDRMRLLAHGWLAPPLLLPAGRLGVLLPGLLRLLRRGTRAGRAGGLRLGGRL